MGTLRVDILGETARRSYRDLRYGLGRVLFAPLTLAEKRLILGGNIRRLLRL